MFHTDSVREAFSGHNKETRERERENCRVPGVNGEPPAVFVAAETLSPILEDSGIHAFAKCESTVKYQSFSLSSGSHHAGHRNAKGVDLMRACPKASRRVKSSRYSILVLSQDNLKVISGKKSAGFCLKVIEVWLACWV